MMIRTLFATLILIFVCQAAAASSITVSGTVEPDGGLFTFRPVYVTLHAVKSSDADRTFRLPMLWHAFYFTQVRTDQRYELRAWTPKGGLVFDPAVIVLDGPQENVVGLRFTYQSE